MASAILSTSLMGDTTSGLFREMLSNPLQFGEPIPKNSWAFDSGTKEVVMGPRSPPPGAGSGSQAKKVKRRVPLVTASQAAEGGDEVVNGSQRTVNGHGNGHGHEKSASSVSPESAVPGSSQKTVVGGLPRSNPSTPTKQRTAQDAKTNSDDSPRQKKAGSSSQQGLHPAQVNLSWPSAIANHRKPAAGLYNPSMACYANATLQVLLHTPPVLNIALAHEQDTCLQFKRKNFCMLCLLHDQAADSHWSSRKQYPAPVLRNLSQIKKGFSKNRQEDTHEFFRFVTDALQNTALAGYPKDLPEKIKHTSWVYRVWGGKVRSRVVCSRCNKPSDTFDHFLDLSLDVNQGKKSILGMLAGFTREDRLEGDNKYHCENCKAKAVATKSFRIQEAPPILTLHLKRFSVNYNSYSGRARADKFNQFIEFGESLDIAPYMVNPKHGDTKYRLFGVTCHRGTELRFGHYTSYVRHPSGHWFHADDEDMMPVDRNQVLTERTAYLLSYIRVPDGASPVKTGTTPLSNGLHAEAPSPLVKRKRSRSVESEDDELPKAKRDGFIGPRVPPSPAAPPVTPQMNGVHPHDSDDEKAPAEEEEDEMPPELPSKFGYQPKSKVIHAPQAIPPSQFYTSPLSRPAKPMGGLSKNQLKKLSKREKLEKRELVREKAGPPMPFVHGQAGTRNPGVFGRMQAKGGHQQQSQGKKQKHGKGKSQHGQRKQFGG